MLKRPKVVFSFLLAPTHYLYKSSASGKWEIGEEIDSVSPIISSVKAAKTLPYPATWVHNLNPNALQNSLIAITELSEATSGNISY